MNRIDEKFAKLKKEGRKAFIPYICAGDPDLSMTKRLVLELETAGSDIVELGVPFSDPLADGPTIQRASERALKAGVTLNAILDMVKELRLKTDIPIVLMTYYNPVFNHGVRKFVKDAKSAGVDGVIVPDLAPEEAEDLMDCAKENDFAVIFLAAPTSSKERLNLIAKHSTGFIYYVSLTGVTGARRLLPDDLIGNLERLKSITKKPICIGFGVSKPEQVKMLNKVSDGVIVGSAIVNKIEGSLSDKSRIPEEVANFVRRLIRS